MVGCSRSCCQVPREAPGTPNAYPEARTMPALSESAAIVFTRSRNRERAAGQAPVSRDRPRASDSCQWRLSKCDRGRCMAPHYRPIACTSSSGDGGYGHHCSGGPRTPLPACSPSSSGTHSNTYAGVETSRSLLGGALGLPEVTIRLASRPTDEDRNGSGAQDVKEQDSESPYRGWSSDGGNDA